MGVVTPILQGCSRVAVLKENTQPLRFRVYNTGLDLRAT